MLSGCGKTEAPESTTEPTVTFETSMPILESETVPVEPVTFDGFYGPQLANYMDHQYYFDGEEIPLAESNVYFINCFQDFDRYVFYGYYPSTALGHLDLAEKCDSGLKYETYGDLFVSYAEESLETDLVICARAKEEGVVLTDETRQEIDTIMVNVANDAASSNMSFDEYIQTYYWKGITEQSFRMILEQLYLVDQYRKSYYETYIEENKEPLVPYVRYALFYAPDTAESADKEKALERANALKDSCKDLNDLEELALAAQDLGTVYETGDFAVFEGSDPITEKWAYDEERAEGDIDIIYDPDWGYTVVGYLGLQEPDENTLINRADNELQRDADAPR